MLGLKAAAVATLCATPGFPEPLVLNARVYRYRRSDVEAFLDRLHAGQIEPRPRAHNVRPAGLPPKKVAWSVDVTTPAPKRLTRA